MARFIDRTLVAGIAIVVALILGNIALAYRNAERVAGTAARVTSAQTILAELERVMTSATEAESAERGYIITEQDRYIAPFYAAEARIYRSIDSLRALMREDSAALAHLTIIRNVAEERMALLRIAIAVTQERGGEAARGIVMTDRGRILMDSLRQHTDVLHRAEVAELEAHAAGYEQSRRFALGTTLAGGIIALAAVAVFVALLHRDMRLRAEVAAALFEQKELFRTTLASIGDAVIATDIEGRVVFVNGIAESLTGWSQKDASGRPLEEVFHIVNEESQRPVENPALRSLREGMIVGLANHTVLIARDGRRTPIDDSAAPIHDARAGTSGAVLVFRDITERRRTERALQEADRHKDEFLAILAHELRNPLAPLRNAVELMHRSPDPASIERVRGMMDRQLEQLVRLTDDLLDVSRITRNKLEMQKDRVDLVGILQSAVETCEPLIASQRHTFVQSIPQGPLWVFGDRARLVQVFYNLIGNAAKYTDPGGEVRLSVAANNGTFDVKVRDNGIGIPQEMLDRVFELFTQADRSVSRSQGGLGIGLTLVRRIVEAHGGNVTAQSEGRGRGSEFVVSLPVMRPAADEPAKPANGGAAQDAQTTAHRVLVADDNRDAADTTAMMLRALGYEVRACYGGEEALECGTSFAPDTMLLDIGMPGISGYDLARKIRLEPWGDGVTLIALTGWGQAEDRKRSMDAGFDHHLVKPVHLRDLRAAIEIGRGPRQS